VRAGSRGRDALRRDPALHASTPFSLLPCESVHVSLSCLSNFLGRAVPDRAGARPYHRNGGSRPLSRASRDRAGARPYRRNGGSRLLSRALHISMPFSVLVHRLLNPLGFVVFKMGRRLGKRVGGSAFSVSASAEARLLFDTTQ
jgi:hypothetical protein